jgi:hypothetical protein
VACTLDVDKKPIAISFDFARPPREDHPVVHRCGEPRELFAGWCTALGGWLTGALAPGGTFARLARMARIEAASP